MRPSIIYATINDIIITCETRQIMVCEQYVKKMNNMVILVKFHGELATYRIAGNFGKENLWLIYSFKVFGGKKFGE